jgi:hypothetical protein
MISQFQCIFDRYLANYLFSLPNQRTNGSSHIYRNNTHPQSYNTQGYYPLHAPNAVPSTPQLEPPRKRRATAPSRPSPSPPGLVPVTFKGILSTDTYQSPYIPSPSQGQPNSGYNSSLPSESPTLNHRTEPNGIYSADGSHGQDANKYDPMFSMPAQYEQENENGDQHVLHHKEPQNHRNTPDSTIADDSAPVDGDGDPFLSLLEQLAENEQSRGGPSELDFFLSGS